MFLALIGAIFAQVLLASYHDRKIAELETAQAEITEGLNIQESLQQESTQQQKQIERMLY